MFLKTLAALLLAVPGKPGDVRLPWTPDGFPPWERNPAEQRHRRREAEEEASRWLRLPRGY